MCRCGWAYTWDCRSAVRVPSPDCDAERHWDATANSQNRKAAP